MAHQRHQYRHTFGSRPTIPWRKNLYENRGLPDNYTDSSFLEELRKNIKPNSVTTKGAITLGASVSIQLSIVIIFVIIFIWLNQQWTTPNIIFSSSAVLTVLGYLCYILYLPDMPDKISKDLRTALIFLAFGYILSPILKTLTETVSTDTIYAMTIFMFLVHLIFSKYGSPQVSLSDSLAITSSIFGSLMLASRLASPLHAFSLLTVAVQSFVLLPFLLAQMENKVVISFTLAASTLYLLFIISPTLSCVYVAVTIFVHVICPLWYIRWQKYKENIYGPWDEAVLARPVILQAVYVMMIFMFLVHLIFGKYGSPWLSFSVSITSSIFGSLINIYVTWDEAVLARPVILQAGMS